MSKTEYIYIQYASHRRSPHETRFESLVMLYPNGTIRYAYGNLSKYVGKPLTDIPLNHTQALIPLEQK